MLLCGDSVDIKKVWFSVQFSFARFVCVDQPIKIQRIKSILLLNCTDPVPNSSCFDTRQDDLEGNFARPRSCVDRFGAEFQAQVDDALKSVGSR